MSLRILFAIHTAADPGTAVFINVSHRAAHLRAMGHTVDVVTPADLPPVWPRLRPLLLPPALLWRRPSRYDVVVLHSYLGWAFHGLRSVLPVGRRTATVTMFHGLEPLYHDAVAGELARTGEHASVRFGLLHHVIVPLLLRRSCRASDGVFCLNRREADYLVERGWCEASRLTVVANGVEPAMFERRAHQGTGSRLLFLGQWLRAKGVRFLAEAFAAIADAHPGVRLVCAGTDASGEAVLEQFPRAVRDRVTVIPRVNRAEVVEQMRQADVFLFPSLSEGFSGALLEAMAAGLAIVTTPVGAAPDLLENERHALLVPCADARVLARAALRLISDAPLRQRLGDAAQGVARSYAWPVVNAAYATELLRVAARRAAVVPSVQSDAVAP